MRDFRSFAGADGCGPAYISFAAAPARRITSPARAPLGRARARQRRARQRDDGIEAAEAERRAIAQRKAALGDGVGAPRIVADDVQAAPQAVVVVAEKQRGLAVGKEAAVDHIVLD